MSTHSFCPQIYNQSRPMGRESSQSGNTKRCKVTERWHLGRLLDPDLEAEAVAGLALRRLAGTGTVQVDTRLGVGGYHKNHYENK